jgi:hypothetical protein
MSIYRPNHRIKTSPLLLLSFGLLLLFLVGLGVFAARTENFWNNFALNLLTEFIGALLLFVVLAGPLRQVQEAYEDYMRHFTESMAPLLERYQELSETAEELIRISKEVTKKAKDKKQ